MTQEAQRAPRSFTQSHAWIQRATGAKAGHRRVPGAREELVERALRFIRPLKDIFTPIWLGPFYRRALATEKSFGREHPSVARDLNNLALRVYLYCAGVKVSLPMMTRSDIPAPSRLNAIMSFIMLEKGIFLEA